MLIWTPKTVIEALRKRSARGLALSYAAVVADDEALTGGARRCFGDWNSALAAAGFDPEAIRRPRGDVLPPGSWSANLVVESILDRSARGLSLAPHRVQIDDGKLYSAAVFHLGSWREAIATAGLESEQLERTWQRRSVLFRIRALDSAGADLSVRTVEAFDPGLYGAACRIFGAWPDALIAASAQSHRRTTRWTAESVIESIQLGATGETKTGGLYKAAIRLFGSWEQAKRAALGAEHGLAVRLRDVRKAAGMSQAKLGARVGRSHRWIGLVEQGAIVPDLRMALQLADALGVAIGDLFALDERGD